MQHKDILRIATLSVHLQGLRANSHKDMRLLAEVIDGVSVSHHSELAARILDADLMRLRGFGFKLAFFIGKLRGVSRDQIVRFFFSQHPDVATDIVHNTAEHCLFGKNKTKNSDAVGGWNQDEVSLCCKILIDLALKQHQGG